MSSEAICPYCQARAAQSCGHLALSAAPGDFVILCVEQAAAQTQWKQFCQAHPKADFTWLETSFGERFLKPLRWHGSVDYEWRTRTDSKTREQVVVLWSKDPRRLWWELNDQIAAELQTARPSVNTGAIHCPVCQQNLRESECEHLVLHGDDLTTADVIRLFNPQGAWEKLKSSNPTISDDAATFLRQHEKDFPSIVRVEHHPWGDETLGFGRDYVFIWAKKPAVFEQEIGKFVRTH